MALAMFACSDNNALIDAQKKDGALPGEFSISPTRKIRFSQGNLQYCPIYDKWRFAENQYDTCGLAAYEKRSATYSGWIDLFAWGTSGCNENALPYSQDYFPRGYYDQDGDWHYTGTTIPDMSSNRNYDWGIYNAISNGGNQKGLWRTPGAEDYEYIFTKRRNCENLCAFAIVNGVWGIILLPDNWKLPAGLDLISFADQNYIINPNNRDDNLLFEYINEALEDVETTKAIKNKYSTNEWRKMESAGAVFLPAEYTDGGGGYRDEGDVVYWTITPNGNGDAWFLWAEMGTIGLLGGDDSMYYGGCVRLIQDIN